MNSNREADDRAALACYLSTVVAIGNCLAEVCPQVGTMYRDRLLKLPRRLGFDATARALEQSRDAVETDLLEFARAAGAWTGMGPRHAGQLLDHLRDTEETMKASADLQNAFLDDLADHLLTSAEVDEEGQLRSALKRCAAGLGAYARRAKIEKLSAIEDLRRRREEIEKWLGEATRSTYIDHETGLLNRIAAELRIQTEIGKDQTFCVIVVTKTGEVTNERMKELADRLAATIRPYDVIFHWSPDQLLTIFEASGAEIAARVQQISGWLVEGASEARTMVSALEHRDQESANDLIARIESVSRPELTAR